MMSLSCLVSAASFDCSRATTWHDRLICQTSALSALDRQVGQLYQQKRAMLSPHGAELLQSSERSWLRYIDTVCAKTLSPTNDSRSNSTSCLQTQYQERLTELAQVAQKLGPFVFNRIDMFAAEPHDASDQSGSVPGFYIQHLAFPQIDNLNSTAVATWNKAYDKGDVAKGAECDSGMGDEDNNYSVGYANQHVTSIQWSLSDYCHGTPHGFFTFRTENLIWDQNSRTLAPSDIFTDGWVPKLQRLFRNALLAQGWRPPDNQADSVWKEVEGTVVDPSHWLFTKDGLSVSFGAYAGGCYVCNPGTPTVPWNDLRPLLVPGSVVP